MEGTNVRLRAYRKSDLETILAHHGATENILNAQGGVPFPATQNDLEGWLGSLTNRGDSYFFIIEKVADNTVIGYCTVQSIVWHASVAQVGIEILQAENQGKGYGTEAMNLLVDFIFSHIGVNKVKLGVFGFNERAFRSYEKSGFVTEGRLREELFRNGQRHDLILMGILRREWEAIRAGQMTR